MDVLDLKLNPDRKRLGTLLIQYHDLMMKCDLVIHVKTHTPWVRLPELWITADKKTRFCYWPTKEISDEFQKEVLKKIFDKYDLDVAKLTELHAAAKKRKKQIKELTATKQNVTFEK